MPTAKSRREDDHLGLWVEIRRHDINSARLSLDFLLDLAVFFFFRRAAFLRWWAAALSGCRPGTPAEKCNGALFVGDLKLIVGKQAPASWYPIPGGRTRRRARVQMRVRARVRVLVQMRVQMRVRVLEQQQVKVSLPTTAQLRRATST